MTKRGKILLFGLLFLALAAAGLLCWLYEPCDGGEKSVRDSDKPEYSGNVHCSIDVSPRKFSLMLKVTLRIANRTDRPISMPYCPAIAEGDNFPQICLSPGNSIKVTDSSGMPVQFGCFIHMKDTVKVSVWGQPGTVLKEIPLSDDKRFKPFVLQPGEDWELEARVPLTFSDRAQGKYTITFECSGQITPSQQWHAISEPVIIE